MTYSICRDKPHLLSLFATAYHHVPICGGAENLEKPLFGYQKWGFSMIWPSEPTFSGRRHILNYPQWQCASFDAIFSRVPSRVGTRTKQISSKKIGFLLFLRPCDIFFSARTFSKYLKTSYLYDRKVFRSIRMVFWKTPIFHGLHPTFTFTLL